MNNQTRRGCLLIILVLSVMALLCACAGSTERYYALSAVTVDEMPADGYTGSLTFSDNGTGTLKLNNLQSPFTWTQDPYELTINELKGTLKEQDGGLVLDIPELGMVLSFDTASKEQISGESSPETGEAYEGRLYFSDCEGEWEEYENRSMAVNGTMMNNQLALYNAFYSVESPMALLQFSDENCTGGYLMAFPLQEYSVKTQRSRQNQNDVNNTEFIRSEEYIWNKYQQQEEGTEAAEELVDVLTLTGSVRNGDGGYSFEIILTPSVS